MSTTSPAAGTPPTPPPGPSLEKIIAGAVSFGVSQVPGASTLLGYNALQLYVPTIYHGYEPFLLVPAAVALASILLVETVRVGRVVVFLGFIALTAAVWWIYGAFPADSPWHFWNWIFWNCAIALFVSLFLHVYLWSRSLSP